MKKELVIYRDLLTAYKAVKATYNEDGSPNQAVWKMAKRVVLRAYEELDYGLAAELQDRAMIKAGLNATESYDYSNFDWDNPENWAKSE